MDSAFELYERHLSEERVSERRKLLLQLQNIKNPRLDFPCRGYVCSCCLSLLHHYTIFVTHGCARPPPSMKVGGGGSLEMSLV